MITLDECDKFYKISEDKLLATNTKKPLESIVAMSNNDRFEIINKKVESIFGEMTLTVLKEKLELDSTTHITKDQFAEIVASLTNQIFGIKES